MHQETEWGPYELLSLEPQHASSLTFSAVQGRRAPTEQSRCREQGSLSLENRVKAVESQTNNLSQASASVIFPPVMQPHLGGRSSLTGNCKRGTLKQDGFSVVPLQNGALHQETLANRPWDYCP